MKKNFQKRMFLDGVYASGFSRNNYLNLLTNLMECSIF